MSDKRKDYNFGHSSPVKYDSPIASLKDRILKPVAHFDRIRALTQSIYQHSTLQTYKKCYLSQSAIEIQQDFEPCPYYPKLLEQPAVEIPQSLSDLEVMQTCREIGVTNSAFARDPLIILESWNFNGQTFPNLRTLQSQCFCSQTFSMLTLDPERRNVARLQPIDIDQISQVLGEVKLI